jgi:hypothetical protein
MHMSKINILIFNFLRLLHVSNPGVHLQEDSCLYSYVVVRCTRIGISSLVSWRMCSKQVKTYKFKHLNINLENVHFVFYNV